MSNHDQSKSFTLGPSYTPATYSKIDEDIENRDHFKIDDPDV